MVQVVESLPSKHEAEFKPQYTNESEREREKRREPNLNHYCSRSHLLIYKLSSKFQNWSQTPMAHT
jgi:hypothetical protein